MDRICVCGLLDEPRVDGVEELVCGIGWSSCGGGLGFCPRGRVDVEAGLFEEGGTDGAKLLVQRVVDIEERCKAGP